MTDKISEIESISASIAKLEARIEDHQATLDRLDALVAKLETRVKERRATLNHIKASRKP